MIASPATLARLLGPRRFALYGDLVQALSLTLVAGVWCAVGVIVIRLAGQTIAQPGSSDFTIFYFTARMTLEGVSPYGALPAAYGVTWDIQHLGNLNPPHVPMLMAPLALLPYADAARLWLVGTYLSAGALFFATGRTIGVPWTLRRWIVWGAAVIANVGFLSVAVTGEWTWFLAWPLWLAWRAARRDRWTQAGVWLGICAGTKLFLLLFLPLLWLSKRGRAGVAMATTLLLTLAMPLLYYPTTILREWLATLGTVRWWWLPMNLSWRGTVSRTLSSSKDYPGSLRLDSWVDPLSVAGALAIVTVLLVWVARRRDAVDADLLFCGGVLASLVLSPLGWVYYLPLALPPFLGLVWTGRLGGLPRGTTWALAIGLAGLYVPLELVTAMGRSSWIGAATVGSLYGWSALIVLYALLRVRPLQARASAGRPGPVS